MSVVRKFLILILFFVLPLHLYAKDQKKIATPEATLKDQYKINGESVASSEKKSIDKYGLCKRVGNTDETRRLFVPTGNRSEWESFINGPGVANLSECYCQLPWGGTIDHGESVTAYNIRNLPFGSSCGSRAQVRVCNGGVLSGGSQYQYASCNVAQPRNCRSPWNSVVGHGGAVNAYASTRVAFGRSCSRQRRSCNNGRLSGYFVHRSCSVDRPRSCRLPWGGTIAHGRSVRTYRKQRARGGCSSQFRRCNNGSLSGNYPHRYCRPSLKQQGKTRKRRGR